MWAEVLDFCNLDRGFTPQFRDADPSTKTFRSEALHRVAHRLKDGIYRAVPRPTVAPEVRRELVKYFAPDVELLGTLVGRDLSAWRAHP